MKKRRITIELFVETNMDDDTLERRLEAFLDPEDLSESLLDDEAIELHRTDIRFSAGKTARDPYGIGVDGPEHGQGIDAPWLDEEPAPGARQAVLEDGPCPECHKLDAHEGICRGPRR